MPALFLLAATAAAFDPAAHQEKLQAMLDRSDYAALNAEFEAIPSQAQFKVDLDWLGASWQRGSSVYVAFAYSQMLVNVAAQLPKEHGDGLHSTAYSVLIYAALVSTIDGAQCEDRSAPGRRFDQAVSRIRAAKLNELPQPEREQALIVALAVEDRNWARRQQLGDAKLLCGGGMAEMTYNLSHGGKVEERPRKPGEFGRQMVVTGGGGYSPAVVPSNKWVPAANARRPEQPKLAVSLAGLPATYDWKPAYAALLGTPGPSYAK